MRSLFLAFTVLLATKDARAFIPDDRPLSIGLLGKYALVVRAPSPRS